MNHWNVLLFTDIDALVARPAITGKKGGSMQFIVYTPSADGMSTLTATDGTLILFAARKVLEVTPYVTVIDSGATALAAVIALETTVVSPKISYDYIN